MFPIRLKPYLIWALTLAAVVIYIFLSYKFTNLLGKPFSEGHLFIGSISSSSVKSINITNPDKTYMTFTYKIPQFRKNEARVLVNTGDNSTKCMKKDRNSPKDTFDFTLVTWHVPLNSPDYFMYGQRQLNEEEKEARIFEIISTYQKNLNHPLIKSLYIVTEQWESVHFLQHIDFSNSSKLVLVLSENGVKAIDMFSFISMCLQGEIAMLTNSDISIGEGFEKINPESMREKKIMYALTRHATWNSHGVCEYEKFNGNADSFLFYVRNFTSTDFKQLSVITQNNPGIENVIIYMFREDLGFNVSNPCKILKTYHQHQVQARNKKGKRVNEVGKNSASAKITDQLL